MPIEVKELIIKAHVTDEKGGDKGGSDKNAALKEEIIMTCLEELNKLIKRQKER